MDRNNALDKSLIFFRYGSSSIRRRKNALDNLPLTFHSIRVDLIPAIVNFYIIVAKVLALLNFCSFICKMGIGMITLVLNHYKDEMR